MHITDTAGQTGKFIPMAKTCFAGMTGATMDNNTDAITGGCT